MFIECPNCHKKFEVDENLIPESGRLVQCGSCQHTWLYKKKIKRKNDILPERNEDTIIEKIDKKSEQIGFNSDHNLNTELHNKKYEIVKKDQKLNKTGLNYFKFLILILISFAALIIVMDTFKVYISYIIPSIDDILKNLYESLIDVYLFFKDLIK